MTNRCENEYECYRGPLQIGNTFSIVATGVSSTNPSYPYVLCNAGYYDIDGTLKERLYFSRDPYDYIQNLKKDSLNNGYTVFSYDKDDTVYTLEYETKVIKDYLDHPDINIRNNINHINNFDTSNIIRSLNLNNVEFYISPQKPIDDGLLHVGTEYSIKNVDDNMKWYFKKDSDETISLRNFMNSNVYTPEDFSKSKSGMCTYSITSLDNNEGFSIFTIESSNLYNDLNIIKDSGRFIIKNDSGTSFYYGYSTKPKAITGGGGVSIHYNKIYENHFTGTGLSIYFFNETSSSNYEQVSNNDNIKFYFIPSEHFSYFPDSRSLQNIIYNHSFQTHSDPNYNYKFIDSFDNKDNLKNKSIPFFVNKIINKSVLSLPDFFVRPADGENLFLGTTFLSNTYTFNNHNNITDIPYLIWTTKTDSIHGYFYPYCGQKETCGHCYGLTNNLSVKCHTHSETYNSGLGALDQGYTAPPMSSSNKPSNLNIIILIVIIFIFFILLGVFIYVRR